MAAYIKMIQTKQRKTNVI